MDVDFIDEDHRNQLLRLPSAAKISEIVEKGLRIPIAQFLTYYLFYKKRIGRDGYRRYSELESKISSAISQLDEEVLITADGINPQPFDGRFDTSITERYGESVGLSVVNAIHDLHEADWAPIPEHSGPAGFSTFDYEHQASDGQRIIQVEAKGSVIEVANPRDSRISNHRRNIEEKKRKIESRSDYRYPAGIRYGTIAGLPREGRPCCWLVDPPADSEDSPRNWRLLARMDFILDSLRFLLPRSPVTASLTNRVRALRRLENPFELDGLRLARPNGNPIEHIVDRNPWARVPHASLSYVEGSTTVGRVLVLPERSMFFIGVLDDILDLAISQDLSATLTYSCLHASVFKRIVCRFTRTQAEREGIEDLDERSNKDRVEFTARGRLFFSRGGLVFGEVTPLTAQAARGG